jgi:membrane protein DedA with SNARE-associated domain
MHSFAASVIRTVSTHQLWAYAAVLALTASESLPIIGGVVPGSIILVGLGAMVPSGAVRLPPLLASAVMGAMAGDALSYWIGYRYSRHAIGWWPFRGHPQLLERARRFMDRHGGRSVFFARFMPGLRGLVPLVAGLSHVPSDRFYIADVIAAASWASVHILASTAVAAGLMLAGITVERLMLLLAGAVVLTVGFLLAYGCRVGRGGS